MCEELVFRVVPRVVGHEFVDTDALIDEIARADFLIESVNEMPRVVQMVRGVFGGHPDVTCIGIEEKRTRLFDCDQVIKRNSIDAIHVRVCFRGHGIFSSSTSVVGHMRPPDMGPDIVWTDTEEEIFRKRPYMTEHWIYVRPDGTRVVVMLRI